MKYRVFPSRRSLFAVVVSLSLLLGDAVAPAFAQTDIYVAQTALGNATGVDAPDAYAMTWLNTSGNWGGNAGQVGPGVTVHLVGTVTTAFGFAGSGTAGNPITILFEPGAIMTSPCWAGSTYAINGSYVHDIIIDGGVNGVIQCTDNGVNLDNQATAVGCLFVNSSYITVKNLTVQNLYIAVSGANDNASAVGVMFMDAGGNGSSNNIVTNCVFHDNSEGVQIDYGTNFSNFTMVNCTAYNCNWGGSAGDMRASSHLDGLTVSGNHFYNWQNWNDPADNNHHNGFYAWAQSGGCLTNLTYSKNIVGPGFAGPHQSAGLFLSGNINNALIINNVINASDGSLSGDGFIFCWCEANTTPGVCRVLNNTIVGGGNGVGIEFFGNGGTGATQTYCCTNNLFINVQTAIAQYQSGSLTLQSDYNLVNNVPAGTAFIWGLASSAWNPAISIWCNYWDSHLNQGNPLLNSSFAPQAGSAAMGTGVNLSSLFTTDFNGNPRPSGTNAWTIGACEPTITGSLAVQISPSDAVAAGAQWQLDNGALQTNGATLTNVIIGQHVVSFTNIAGWAAPSNQAVSISANSPTNIVGVYSNAPQTGGLQVTILPASAASAGATWQTNNGGAFLSSGALITNVPAASNFVSFSTVAGWVAPPGQAVFITNGQITEVTNTYTPSTNLTSTGTPPAWNADLHVVQPTTKTLLQGISGGGPTNNLNGLVAWWTLDDLSGTDASGNSNTLTFNGSPTLVPGDITNAVSLNGSSQYADAGTGTSLNPTNAITVMAWVNFNSFSSSYSAVVSKGVNGGANALYQILVKSTGQLAVNVQSTSAAIGYDGSGSYTLSPGTWYHIAFTYSSGTGLVGYVNGQQDGTSAGTGPLQSNSADTTIGVDLNTSGRLANAIIDDVRIYNRALSATEIASQYQWSAVVSAQ